MGVPSSVRARYSRDQVSLAALRKYISPTLAEWCGHPDRGYRLHDRVKELASVTEKLETGRYRKWSDLDDLVAFTVVVPTSEHEEDVIEMLDERFRRADLRKRGSTRKAPDIFRFDSPRWYGRAPNSPPPPLDDRAAEMLFEVQTKTAFEDAWSSVTHDLVYKGQDVNWRKKRLAAQLKAQVEQVDLLLAGFNESAGIIAASPDSSTDAQRLVVETFKGLVENEQISSLTVPQSWQRFAECVYGLARNGTRGARDAERRVQDICEGFDAAVRAGSFSVSMSGSLFQAVVAWVAQSRDEGWLEGFPVVWSREFDVLYSVEDLPSLVDLDA